MAGDCHKSKFLKVSKVAVTSLAVLLAVYSISVIFRWYEYSGNCQFRNIPVLYTNSLISDSVVKSGALYIKDTDGDSGLVLPHWKNKVLNVSFYFLADLQDQLFKSGLSELLINSINRKISKNGIRLNIVADKSESDIVINVVNEYGFKQNSHIVMFESPSTRSIKRHLIKEKHEAIGLSYNLKSLKYINENGEIEGLLLRLYLDPARLDGNMEVISQGIYRHILGIREGGMFGYLYPCQEIEIVMNIKSAKYESLQEMKGEIEMFLTSKRK